MPHGLQERIGAHTVLTSTSYGELPFKSTGIAISFLKSAV